VKLKGGRELEGPSSRANQQQSLLTSTHSGKKTIQGRKAPEQNPGPNKEGETKADLTLGQMERSNDRREGVTGREASEGALLREHQSPAKPTRNSEATRKDGAIIRLLGD